MNYTNENTELDNVIVTYDINNEYVVEVFYSTDNDCRLVERFECKDREEVYNLLNLRYNLTEFEYQVEDFLDSHYGHDGWTIDWLGYHNIDDFINYKTPNDVEGEAKLIDKINGDEED